MLDTRVDLGLSKAWTDFGYAQRYMHNQITFQRPATNTSKIRYHYIDDQGNSSWIHHLLRVSRTDKRDSRQSTLYKRLKNVRMPLVHGAMFEGGGHNAANI